MTSVLAIGGIGGLAIGLAGREICENLLNGFLIMSTVGATTRGLHVASVLLPRGRLWDHQQRVGRHSMQQMARVEQGSKPLFASSDALHRQNPFEVGDEVTFFHNNKTVEGFVIDIGWYRTLIRSFEREVGVVLAWPA